MDTVIWYGLSRVLSTLTSLCLLQLNSLVVLYKNAEGKNMNTSLSFLLFLNSVNSANLVRKSLMTTKAWQLLIAVLLYKKKKKMTKCIKIRKLGRHSHSPVVTLTGCSGWSACWPLERCYCPWLILCFRL